MPITTSIMADGITLLQIGTNGADVIRGDVYFDGTLRIADEIRGGAGADSLSGATGQNDLFGQAGDDYIVLGQGGNTYDRGYGGKGKDIFDLNGAPGSAGKTHLAHGGAGTDSAYLNSLAHTQGVTLFNQKISVAGQLIARLNSIELVFGSSKNDTMTASGAVKTLTGFAGGDALTGSDTQRSILVGGAGNDQLQAGAGGAWMYDGDESHILLNAPRFYDDNDILTGGIGRDILVSYSGNDILRGGDNQDFLVSVHGDDRLYGGAGNDGVTFDVRYATQSGPQISGRAQSSLPDIYLNGGKGWDTVNFTDLKTGPANGDFYLNQGLRIDLAQGRGVELATGHNGRFKLLNFEQVIGTERQDKIYGSGGGNTLNGDDGRDLIDGRGGDDEIDGGRGNDRLKGGAGDDVFEFTSQSGKDRILDFEDFHDKIRFVDLGLNFASLTITSTADQSGSVISWGASRHQITVENLQISQLTAADFEFI